MEKIAMKCTRKEYDSIKEFVGELRSPCEKMDFVSCNYLSTSLSTNMVLMLDVKELDKDRKVYETFDKDMFLKACGINTPKKIPIIETIKEIKKNIYKVKKDKRKKMFKKTIKLLKSFDDLKRDIRLVDIKYGTDGSFTITITGNKTK